MNKRLTVAILAVLSNLFCISAFAQTSVGIEYRNVYTRWYEYPGRYWEEDFKLYGLRGDYLNTFHQQDALTLYWGLSAAIYKGSYINSPGNSFDATAARVGATGQVNFRVGNNVELLARLELPYWIGMGEKDNDKHTDDFGVYFPSIDVGLGATYRFDGSTFKTISAIYGFSVADLGVSTDMYFQNSVASENWANSGVTITLGF